MKPFYHFGRYLLLLKSLLYKPEKMIVFWNITFREMTTIGVGSVAIVVVISLFMGAVLTIQTAYQIINPLISISIIGSIVSDSSIMALGSTITCLVLAGKIGSNIASELGTMRVSEQIDALEIMGVNSSGYLILPKIIASMIVIPLLVMISTFLCIYGGLIVGQVSGLIPNNAFIEGAQETFKPFTVFFAMIKTVTFAFLISSISSYHGYFVSGGALEVGKASTKAVVYSCIFILMSDYVLAELILND